MTGGIAHTAGDLTVGNLGINPLASQLGHLSMQDRAFLDVFNKQEQQELHGGPREGPVDPRGLLGQLEQAAIGHRGHMVSDDDRRPGHPRHHEIVSELAPEEVRSKFSSFIRKSCLVDFFCLKCHVLFLSFPEILRITFRQKCKNMLMNQHLSFV